MDKNITDKIVRLAKLKTNNALIIEVGPGPGLLTRSILTLNVPTVVIEKDHRFIPSLEQLADRFPHLKILRGDILETDSSLILKSAGQDAQKLDHIHLIGNLPFSISTVLLIQWLKQIWNQSDLFKVPQATLTLMFQKEVANRILAPVSTSHRTRLSVMSQYLCQVKTVYNVNSAVFVPKPLVDATVVQLVPKRIASDHSVHFDEFEKVVRFLFQKRRKQIQGIMRDHDKKFGSNLLRSLQDLNIDPHLRPQDLSCELFYNLAKLIHPQI